MTARKEGSPPFEEVPRKPLRQGGPLLLSLLLAACGPVLKVNTQHAPSAVQAAGSYRTYAWAPPPGDVPRNVGPDAHVDVTKSVDAYLQARGYQRVEASAAPDFLLQWKGDIENHSKMTASSSFDRAGPSTFEQAKVTWYVLGLDILDASTKEPVWNGTAKGELKGRTWGRDAKERHRKAVLEWLDTAVPKLLGDFPPRTEAS